MIRGRRFWHLLLLAGLIVGWSAGSAAAADTPRWGYEGETGPEHWGELDPSFALCSAGTTQSPVDIPASAPLDSAPLTHAYQPSAVTIFNNGHTVQVNYDPGSTLTLDDEQYTLLQFHFHAHSEHTLAGAPAPMEVHFVHRNAAGGLAVVGAWIQSGAANPAFDAVLNHLPASVGQPEAVAGATVNADALLPADQSHYRYAGSLTTPPCTEGVKWLVLEQPIELAPAQIAAFTALFDNDFRPTQPLNGRTFQTGAPAAVPPVATLPSTGEPLLPGLLTLTLVGLALLIMGWQFRRGLKS